MNARIPGNVTRVPGVGQSRGYPHCTMCKQESKGKKLVCGVCDKCFAIIARSIRIGYYPTTAMPGSAKKLAVLQMRAKEGFPIFHPQDNVDLSTLINVPGIDVIRLQGYS